MNMNMRDIMAVVEGKKMIPAVPVRQGSSIASWKQYIIAMMLYRKAKYGPDGLTWKVTELSKVGAKAAEQLAAEGIIVLDVEQTNFKAEVGGRHFGRSGQIPQETVPTHVIAPGPNFPS